MPIERNQMAEKKQAVRRRRPVEVRVQAVNAGTQKQHDRWSNRWRGGQADRSALSRIAEQNANQTQ